MSDKSHILVETRNDYTRSLTDLLCPHLIESFHDMYTEAVKISEGNNVMLKFQTLCQEVKTWNNNIIKEHTEKIKQQCSWVGDLIAAIFVCHVKILSSVNINKQSEKLKIKIPTNESFIHRCFINAAKNIYSDPHIMAKKELNTEDMEILTNRFCNAINDCIRENIPVEDILTHYFSNPQMNNTEDGIDFGDDVEEGELPLSELKDEEEEEEEVGR